MLSVCGALWCCTLICHEHALCWRCVANDLRVQIANSYVLCMLCGRMCSCNIHGHQDHQRQQKQQQHQQRQQHRPTNQFGLHMNRELNVKPPLYCNLYRLRKWIYTTSQGDALQICNGNGRWKWEGYVQALWFFLYNTYVYTVRAESMCCGGGGWWWAVWHPLERKRPMEWYFEINWPHTGRKQIVLLAGGFLLDVRRTHAQQTHRHTQIDGHRQICNLFGFSVWPNAEVPTVPAANSLWSIKWE